MQKRGGGWGYSEKIFPDVGKLSGFYGLCIRKEILAVLGATLDMLTNQSRILQWVLIMAAILLLGDILIAQYTATKFPGYHNCGIQKTWARNNTVTPIDPLGSTRLQTGHPNNKLNFVKL